MRLIQYVTKDKQRLTGLVESSSEVRELSEVTTVYELVMKSLHSRKDYCNACC
jgi:hypothetical protein